MNTSVHIDGDKIRRLREEKDLTQLYLATVVGVTTDTISRWENRRYPSIRMDNAQKLAEALEVPLEEILRQPASDVPGTTGEKALFIAMDEDGGAAGLKDNTHPWRPKLPHRFRPVFLAVFLFILVMGGVFWGIMENRGTVSITATRLVPRHAAPGSVFPVIVRITVTGPAQVPVLVRELLACNCETVGVSGEVEMFFGKKPRWIGTTSGGEAVFLYLVRPGPEQTAGQVLFSGEAALRFEEKTVSRIAGSDRVGVLPFHWADGDRNYRISDDEILLAFENFSVVPGKSGFLDEVEKIWLAGEYGWDKRTNSIFLPKEETSAQQRSEQ